MIAPAARRPPHSSVDGIDEFQSMGDRIASERAHRKEIAARALQYGIALFDDYFRALGHHDLVLLGAGTGLGKTELVLSIAAANARRDVRVRIFALEAEPYELERRVKYSAISDELWRRRHPRAAEFNYADWYFGRVDDISGDLEDWAERKVRAELSTLRTFYRGKQFGHEALVRWILETYEDTDLFVLDHLHYVDAPDAEDENRAVTDLMMVLRDVVLRIGRPIVLVAHLRKKDERAHKLVPGLGDFHGSSNITKICTQVVTLERATDIEPSKWYLSPTFISISKDRRLGAPPYVVLTTYDLRTRTYQDHYTLGRASGRKWVETPIGDAPSWARNHRPLASDGTASRQEPVPVTTPPQHDDAPHAATSAQ